MSSVPPRDAAGKGGERRFITLVVILLVVGTAIIGYKTSRPRSVPVVQSPPAAGAPSAGTPAVTPPPAADFPKPAAYVIGNANAPIEILEYADFECPVCGEFARVTEPDVRKKIVNAGLARYRFIDFPIPQLHPNSLVAHNAAACAAIQDKFWAMHDKIYSGQAVWSIVVNGPRSSDPASVFREYAVAIGLDTAAFNTCFAGKVYEPQIMANLSAGFARGVRGTPSFLIGSRMAPGIMPYGDFKAYVDSALADARAAKSPRK